MGCIKSVFGTSGTGETVYRYTLTNGNGVRASFTDLGAIWLTMEVPDRDGKQADVVLAAGEAADIADNPGHMGEIVGRNANRIGGARFVLNGVTYRLDRNNPGGHNLHSGLHYYRDRVWKADTEETPRGTCVKFSLLSPDGDQGYPGNASITVSYTLTEDNSVRIDYHMTCDADTIANMTNHAYFNLAGHDSGSAMDQQVWIGADAYTPTDADSIPTGEVRPVEGTPMDFRTMKPLGRDIGADDEQLRLAGGYDHNFALNHAPGEMDLVAKACDAKSGRTLEVYTDLPGLQLYTANSLSTDKGKNGAVYGKRSGYCFETQYFPDAVNQPGFLSPVLKRGDEYATTTIYKFGVE